MYGVISGIVEHTAHHGGALTVYWRSTRENAVEALLRITGYAR